MKNKKQKYLLISLQLIFLIILLVSDWTNFSTHTNLFYLKSFTNPWIRILIYFPLIANLQIELFELEELNVLSTIYFVTLFLLELFTMINQVVVHKIYELPLIVLIFHVCALIILITINTLLIKSNKQ